MRCHIYTNLVPNFALEASFFDKFPVVSATFPFSCVLYAVFYIFVHLVCLICCFKVILLMGYL